MSTWAEIRDPDSVRSTDGRGLVVLCAANNWDDVKLADRHMAEHLAAHGPVLYVDPPISHLTRLNKPTVAGSLAGSRLRTIGPGLTRYTPLVAPKPLHPAMVRTTERSVRRQLRSVVGRLGLDVRAVVTTWLFLDVFGCVGESARIYWWQDDPAGAAELWGATKVRLVAADERLARSADIVVAVSEDAATTWRERGVEARFLPNGCDTESFSDLQRLSAYDSGLPRPIAGFVGHLNARTDLALLEAVAARGTSLVLIGPKDPSFEPVRFTRLERLSNVAYLGPQPFDALPCHLAGFDVGLVPYACTEFNRSSFPMKTLEYLSAGLRVVSTSLPAVRWLDTSLVELADDPGRFADAVEVSVSTERSADEIGARRKFAARHSWKVRAHQLDELIATVEQTACDLRHAAPGVT